MDLIFSIVYKALVTLSKWTGLSYKEINIVVYYVLTPFVFFALIDKILKKPVTSIVWFLIVIVSAFLIDDFSAFSDKLFDDSVVFLKWFSVIGISYVVASVIICVIIPSVLFVMLLHLAYPGLVYRITHLKKKPKTN